MDFGTEFLTGPDFFPARLAGEAWGERAVVLTLPGGPYRIAGLSQAQETIVRGRFRGFLGPHPPGGGDGTPVELRVFRAPQDDFRDFGPLREYRVDVDYLPDAVRVAGIDLMAVLELSPPGGALWTSREEACEFGGACENFLRVVVAYGVFRQGAVMLHSAALDDGGTALLFPGRSGAGKSTLCALARAAGRRVLGDEIHILRARPAGSEELWVEAVPFAGDFGPVEGPLPAVPLGAVSSLRHAAADDLRPLSAARALALLLSTAPYLNHDPFRASALEDLLAVMLGRCAFRELSFTRTSRLEILAALRSPEAVA